MKSMIKLLLSALFLWLLVSITGVEKIWLAIQSANLAWLLPCVAVYLFGQWVSAVRWRYLARVLGFNQPLADYVDLYFLGMVASLFLPGAMGGDAVRTLLLAQWSGKRKREAVLTLLAERGVGLLTLLWMAAMVCALPVTDTFPLAIKQPVWALAGFSVVGWLAALVLPVEAMAEKFKPLQLVVMAKPYWGNLKVVAVSLGLSAIVQGGMVVIHWLMALATGVDAHPLVLVAVYCLVTIVSALPIAFAGFGVREGAYQALLGFVGVASGIGLAYGLYWAMILLITTAVAGAWVLWKRPGLLAWARSTSPKTQGDDAPSTHMETDPTPMGGELGAPSP